MTTTFPTQPVAAISGGLGDIGFAAAHALKKTGCRVALGDLRDAGRDTGGFHVHHVDVASEASVQAWFGAVEAAFGEPASIIVVNAGIACTGSAMSATLDDWNRTLSVNLTGAWLTARAGARRLIEKQMPGRIVFVGSWAAHAPHVELAAYCAAKAGVRMLAQCLALELAGKGILVNEVAPGFVNAGLSGQFFRKDPALAARSSAAVPLGQLIEPGEVAAAIAYLCSPAHRNLTGSTLLLDGGLSLLRGPASKP
ncbi:MAG: SDR family oxidoreductase [Verrucomicrobia bacterium]|nr:SDR family oxidoreductase [Verrucomicrobiota bacterium]